MWGGWDLRVKTVETKGFELVLKGVLGKLFCAWASVFFLFTVRYGELVGC